MAGRGKSSSVVEPVIEVLATTVKEAESSSDSIPYANHEYQNISNRYLAYLKEKASVSLLDTSLTDEAKNHQESFLKAATAILDYRTTNGIIVD